MKLSVRKKTLLSIKIVICFVSYISTAFLSEARNYIAFASIGIAFILLGFILWNFQYLREKPKRLAFSYVLFLWLLLIHLIPLIAHLVNERFFDGYWGSDFLSIIVLILSISIYFLVSKKVKPVLSAKSKPFDVDSNFTTESYMDFSNDPPMDSLKKLTTPLKATFSLLLLSNILAVLALPFKQYVSLAFVIPVVIAAAILPLSKYLREESGRLSLAYIALLNVSYLMIFPAAVIGFTFNGGAENWFPLLLVTPPALLAVSFLIYFPNRVNVNPIIKGILRKMCYERKSRIHAFKQLGETEAKKYKNKLYLVIFVSLTVLNVIIVLSLRIFSDSGDNNLFFLYNNMAYLILAVFMLKRFLPIARVYPLALYYFIPLGIAGIFFSSSSANIATRLATLIGLYGPFFLILLGLISAVYAIYRDITESKFAWGDAAVGTKEAVVDIENEDNKIRSKFVK